MHPSKRIAPFVSKLIIDSKQKFSPQRITKRETIKPNHYPLILTFSNLPTGENNFGKETNQEKHEIMWNTNKKGGWNEYKEVTENNERLDRTFMEESIDINRELKKTS